MSTWYLDNGASNHMIGDKTKFHKFDDQTAGVVRFGDGYQCRSQGKDLLSLTVDMGTSGA